MQVIGFLMFALFDSPRRPLRAHGRAFGGRPRAAHGFGEVSGGDTNLAAYCSSGTLCKGKT